MPRLVLAAALFLAAPAVLAQAVTRPVVTVSAGVLRSSDGYDQTGDSSGGFATVTALSASLGAEVPVWQRNGTAVSAGATLVAASYGLGFDDSDGSLLDGRLRPQRLDAFGRVGIAQASALLGVSLNLGRDLYDFDETSDQYDLNSDGQNAVIARLRYEVPAGRLTLSAQVDAALVPATRETVAYTEVNGPGEPSVVTPLPVDIDNGDLYGFQFGARVPVGPVQIGLSLFYATRTEGTFEYAGSPPPNSPPGTPTTFPNRLGYREAVGLIPSVSYRTPDGRVTVRAEGAFSDLFSMEGTPVGITLSGAEGPVTRPALTIRASVGL